MISVGFVPIKLNSRRLPGKNLKLLGEKPLLWHIVKTLLSVNGLDAVYVYCSDDSIIEHLPVGAKFLQRDPKFDGEFVKGAEIYRAFLETVAADIYLLAHATSPFSKAATMQTGLDAVRGGGYDSAFAAKKEQTFVWYKNKPLNYELNDVPRTQDIEPVYIKTSAFYVFRQELFLEHGRRIGFSPYMALTDAVEAVDIDYPEDFRLADAIHETNTHCGALRT
jgi:CMP-N-acetylneuraminic acid synthetase